MSSPNRKGSFIQADASINTSDLQNLTQLNAAKENSADSAVNNAGDRGSPELDTGNLTFHSAEEMSETSLRAIRENAQESIVGFNPVFTSSVHRITAEHLRVSGQSVASSTLTEGDMEVIRENVTLVEDIQNEDVFHTRANTSKPFEEHNDSSVIVDDIEDGGFEGSDPRWDLALVASNLDGDSRNEGFHSQVTIAGEGLPRRGKTAKTSSAFEEHFKHHEEEVHLEENATPSSRRSADRPACKNADIL
jgi:hypothetical protein